MEPIRVLHVVTHMNRGGLETMIMNYYRKIDKSLVQFDFLTHRPETEKKDYDDEIISMGGKVFHLPRLNPFSIKYKLALRRFLSEHKGYKIIHVHQDCLSGIILCEAKKQGINIRIAHCHSSNQDKDVKLMIKKIYKKNIKKYATEMISCGKEAGKWMFGTDQFEVLPNAIDSELYIFNPAAREKKRKEMHITGEEFAVVHIGRFSAVKNHKFLIDIFEKIVNIEPKAVLWLVGRGGNEVEIQRYIREKKLQDHVVLWGLRSDIPEILQAADAFVLPSLYEGVPVSAIEAQAADLPCFISDGVPADCMITDNIMILSLNQPPEIWAECILQSRNHIRRNTQKMIVEKGFDITKNARFLQEHYLELIKESAR